MWQPPQWQAKATEYTIRAQEITYLDLRRQFTELAARHLEIAKELEDNPIVAAGAAQSRED